MHDITGTTTITGLGTVRAGIWKVLQFDGALTFTHNATSLILPGGANITTAAGDIAIMFSEGSGNWRCLAYQKASGLPVLGLPDAQGDFIIGETSGNTVSVPHPLGGAQIINGKIALSVGSSALTVALKGLDGNDPSATNPVFIRIPQLTSNVFDGTYAIRKVTAALSVVVSSGSTLGHTSAVACPVYFYLLDNAGTPELAVSSRWFGTPSVVSTTAEGGAGAADSASVMYSTTARSNVSVCAIGRWKSTQTTAGTWAAVTGEQQLYPFPFKAPTVTTITSTGANNYDMPWDALWLRVTVQAGGGSGAGAPATGTGQVSAGSGGGGGGAGIKIIKDGSAVGRTTATVGAGGTAASAGGAGNTGGSSSFGSIVTTTGGAAGAVYGPSALTTWGSIGGVGGTSSGGDFNITGGAGDSAGVWVTTPAANSGKGGASLLGVGGNTVFSSGAAAANAGIAYGGGSSGAVNGNQSLSAAVGAAGANGVIIVEEYYQ